MMKPPNWTPGLPRLLSGQDPAHAAQHMHFRHALELQVCKHRICTQKSSPSPPVCIPCGFGGSMLSRLEHAVLWRSSRWMRVLLDAYAALLPLARAICLSVIWATLPVHHVVGKVSAAMACVISAAGLEEGMASMAPAHVFPVTSGLTVDPSLHCRLKVCVLNSMSQSV